MSTTGTSVEPRVAVHDGDALGEGPCWDDRTGELLRVDITGRLVHRFDPSTGSSSRLEVDDDVSAVIPRAGGGLVLAMGHDIVVRDAAGAQEVLARVEVERDDNRFNDCRCDAAGRLWAGTMSRTRTPGVAALYRIDPDGSVAAMVTGTTISNGLSWSPDGETMYFIDSTTHRIDAFEFDVGRGTLSGRHTVIATDPADGLPDGMAVDAEGGLWVAFFGGGAVRRYSPTGDLDVEIRLPVSNPTCPTFGGDDLATLYVTSAKHKLTPEQLAAEPLAGAVFALRPGVAGRPIARFAG